MKLRRIGFSCAVFLILLTAAKSEEGLPSEKISLAKLGVAGWHPTSIESYIGKALYDAIDGYADYHMGFNFKDSEKRSFTNGDKRIAVFSYRFDSPENAFGLYSVMRMGSVKLLDVGNEASFQKRLLHMWKGPYYVTVTDLGEAECSEEEILAFARAVDAQFARRYARPSLVAALPGKHLVPHSVTYFHYRNALEHLIYLGEENVLQLGEDFDKPYDVEAAYGQFLIDKTKYEVVVLRYESAGKPEIAARMLAESMKDSLKSSTTTWPWAELVERNGRQTIVFRQGSILMFSFPTAKGDVVRGLMEQVIANLKPAKG
jgi:hypothetical protein